MSTVEGLRGDTSPAEILTERMGEILDTSDWLQYKRRFSGTEMEVRERALERTGLFGRSVVTYRQRRKVDTPERVESEIDIIWLADRRREIDSWTPEDTIHPNDTRTRERILGWAESAPETDSETS